MNSLPNDIEPIVEITNYSFHYFITLIFIGVIGFYFFTKLLLKFLKNRTDNRKVFIKILRDLDWNSPKETAYKITKYGRLITRERSEKLLDELILDLDLYKYRKDETPISDEVKGKFYIFLEVVENE